MFNIKKGSAKSLMYVCICMAVTDQDIQAAIHAGAATVAEVTQCSGAGGRCGSCRPTIATMLQQGPCPAPSSLPLRRSLPMIDVTRTAA